MTIGPLPMNCTEIGTEFSTATPFTLGDATLLSLGELSVPYNVSAWVGKSNGFSLTCGLWSDEIEYPFLYRNGFDLSPLIGSRTPTTYRGHTINACYRYSEDPSTGEAFVSFYFELATAGLGASFFTSLIVNGQTFLSSAASYVGAGISSWTWTTPDPGIVSPNVYPVTFT